MGLEYNKMIECIGVIIQRVISAVGRNEYEDEPCGSRFELIQKSVLPYVSYEFSVVIPDYGANFLYDDLKSIFSSVPDNSSMKIQVLKNGSTKISLIFIQKEAK